MTAFRLRTLVALAVASATLAGCAQPSTPSEESTDTASASPDAETTRVTLLDLEDQLHRGVDSLQCDLALLGDGDPTFVSNGFVVETGSELREMCVDLVEPRTGATWNIDARSVHLLSNDLAYVVRRGTYTINFKARETQVVDPVITTIWQREAGMWKMVHLHESSVELF